MKPEHTVLREPEHGSPRTGAHPSWRTGAHLSWSTVLREPEHTPWRTSQLEHGSPRTRARFSDNRSTPKLENRRTPQWRTGEHLSGEPENTSVENRRTSQWRTGEHPHVFHLLRVLHLLHVLPARLVGWNNFCTPECRTFSKLHNSSRLRSDVWRCLTGSVTHKLDLHRM